MRASTFTTITAALLTACSGAPGPGGSGDESTSEATAGATTGASTGTSAEPTTTTTTTTTTTDAATTDASASSGEPPGACGDGVRDRDEVCDGADLGGQTCPDLGPQYTGGVLACADNCASFDASGCELAPGSALVALNEVSSAGALMGEWADKGDLIELYNAGDAAADLSGYKLSDDPTFPADKTYVFPDGAALGPGEWLVLVQYDDMSGEGDFPFGLSQDSPETLTLVDAADQPVDSVTFEGAAAKLSYCRVPDGLGGFTPCVQTFGAANAASVPACGDGLLDPGEDCDGAELGGADCTDQGFDGGALACTDACAFDTAGCTNGEALVLNELESTQDDIELYNAGNAPIDLSGWILTDDLVDNNYDPMADPEKLVFAAQTTLPAKGFLVVPKGMNVNQHPFGLGGSGDTVTLLRPNLDLVDQVSYAAGEADLSYCRLPDGPGGAWTPMCTPTLGAPNKGG